MRSVISLFGLAIRDFTCGLRKKAVRDHGLFLLLGVDLLSISCDSSFLFYLKI